MIKLDKCGYCRISRADEVTRPQRTAVLASVRLVSRTRLGHLHKQRISLIGWLV